jgi:hypothetical protein
MHEQRRIGVSAPIETGICATVLGKAGEEHGFLDEPASRSRPIRVKDTSAFDIFPDEDYGKDPVAMAKSDRSPIRLFEVKRVAADAAAVDEAAAMVRIRPVLLLVFFLAAALAAFGTVRACQVSGLSSSTLSQFVGR